MKALTSTSRSKVYNLFSQGLTAREIASKTHLQYQYVNDLCFEWSVEIARGKQKEGIEATAKAPLKSNVSESDFVLITNDPLVLLAYQKMISPIKDNTASF